ncbi:hypothetical protein BASA50_010043 [Batrachochytrium salamandrivorans]|uniref:Uncharacterized protein n=1 Tax=Batrachochytrium salamandrivorans TaxID=1357716 RepID=A0ABQ8EZH3_9FUNG|nr:hypothetical protein BASA50_010043 [Batrachochytrium salamandrivorans]
MLSRLIITFLCAAAIGSVSGAFLTFDPELIVLERVEAPISFSVKLKSKPTEAVTVHLQHPFCPCRPDESTRDIEVQVFMDECTARLSCIKKVLARYGPTVMRMDVSGPVKSLREYSTTVVNNGGIMSLDVDILLATGYPSPGGLCNRPRDPSPDNRLIGRNGRLYRPEIVPTQSAWNCVHIPRKPTAKTVIPVPTTTTTTTTTLLSTTTTATTSSTTTVDFSTYVSSFTVDLSESTLAPTITYALSSTTITTSPSTTSTTSPYHPDPPAPGRYVRPLLPPPGE